MGDRATPARTVAFQIDLWARRRVPSVTLPSVMVRQKEISIRAARAPRPTISEDGAGAGAAPRRELPPELRDSEDSKILTPSPITGPASILEKLPQDLRRTEDCQLLQAVVDRSVYKIIT
jgi:hypothetical protein